MWVFTVYGFFSVTESPEAAGVLQIRARDSRDLKDLKARHFLTSKIIETDHTDYRWRLLVSPAIFAEIMAKEVLDINYSNFKNACSQRQKARPLMAVWATMATVQQRIEDAAQQPRLPLFDFDDPVYLEEREALDEPEEPEITDEAAAAHGMPDWTPPLPQPIPPCNGKTYSQMQQEEADEQFAAQSGNKRGNPRKKAKRQQTNPF